MTEVTGLIFKVLNRPPRGFEGTQTEIPKDLTRVLAQALARDSLQRYGSCEALADDLERTATGLGVQAPPLSTAGRRRWQ